MGLLRLMAFARRARTRRGARVKYPCLCFACIVGFELNSEILILSAVLDVRGVLRYF
jgi:hypothetical protein